jgi:hypothetical protein
MRRDRPAPVMPSTVLDPFMGAVQLAWSRFRDFVGERPRLASRRGFRICIALHLVQKQLIIYLRKVRITKLCNQCVTGSPEARFLGHESCSLRKGIDD